MLKFEMSTPSGLYVHMNISIATFESSYPGKVFLDSSSTLESGAESEKISLSLVRSSTKLLSEEARPKTYSQHD